MYSVPMALIDFIPVLLFGAAAVLLQRDLYSKMVKGAYALFAAGTIDVFMAGFLKALYKLLYALGVCDFQPLTQMFFPVQALGFLMAGCGALYIGTRKGKQEKVLAAAALPVYKGTMIFVGLMVAGLGMMYFGLVRVARKLKKTAGRRTAHRIICLHPGYGIPVHQGFYPGVYELGGTAGEHHRPGQPVRRGADPAQGGTGGSGTLIPGSI